jgi:insertion element IS1 protein InsB
MNFVKIYEVDEMRTFLRYRDKLIWIVYTLERDTKKVVSFNVGRRTNNTLSRVLDSIVLSNPLVIYTDKLKHYKYLIDQTIHKTNRFGTNHIERKNLTLRTHLKRLNRRTICYSKSIMILSAILSIYFWG